MNYFDKIATHFQQLSTQHQEIDRIAEFIKQRIAQGSCIFFCGNGGSAADSQHLAAEFIGRYKKERRALPAIALTVDSSALTAIGNDYGFNDIFARQLSGLAKKDDLLIAISTSGNSSNVLEAIKMAKEIGVTSIGLTGSKGGKMAEICDESIKVPSDETNHIQEMHIAIGHYICGICD
ncbi:MAG: D-sedoheptulose 7-phosphate isomerase [Alphaproteobacteria bacterium]|nr:D-sedoheptulose 7-phosphate isomerase [Alphaproteobacteria bacterium]